MYLTDFNVSLRPSAPKLFLTLYRLLFSLKDHDEQFAMVCDLLSMPEVRKAGDTSEDVDMSNVRDSVEV